MASQRRALRMPGRIYREFVVLAIALTEQPDLQPEQEALCEALGRARVKPRGFGHTAIVPLEPEYARLLMVWVTGTSPKFLRDYRDAVLEALRELEASGGRGGAVRSPAPFPGAAIAAGAAGAARRRGPRRPGAPGTPALGADRHLLPLQRGRWLHRP